MVVVVSPDGVLRGSHLSKIKPRIVEMFDEIKPKNYRSIDEIKPRIVEIFIRRITKVYLLIIRKIVNE
jgi:hypothetical protein